MSPPRLSHAEILDLNPYVLIVTLSAEFGVSIGLLECGVKLV